MNDEKVFTMKLGKVYPCLVNKAAKKGHTKDEVNEVIFWFTGYDEAGMQAQLARDVDYRTFFEKAPHINDRADKITGSVCGIRVETIEDPLMRHIRQLDKLIDELAKGIPMYKVLRMDPSEYPVYEFDAVLLQNGDMNAGYVEIPFDVQKTFGKSRVPVHATFDGVDYDGQIVRMGTPCHIIGVRKDIREKIGRTFGEFIHVTVRER